MRYRKNENSILQSYEFLIDPEDEYYRNFLLEEIKNVEAGFSYDLKKEDKSMLLSLIISNHFWTMFFNNVDQDEKILQSTSVDYLTFETKTSKLLYYNNKTLRVYPIELNNLNNLDNLNDINIHISDILIKDSDFILFSAFENINTIYEDIVLGETIRFHLLGGTPKERFIRMNSNDINLEDIVDIRLIETLLEVKKGIR